MKESGSSSKCNIFHPQEQPKMPPMRRNVIFPFFSFIIVVVVVVVCIRCLIVFVSFP